uniref:C2H2-type domain-containing protein n=1 Tax=Periophthalmus magnuspinnatus TaxID=409849 RepID=A0A3B4ATG3_9GOBI
MSDGSQSSGASPGGRAAPGSSPEDLERRFKCGECGKSYRHAGSLVNHKRCHQTGQYQCSVCGKHLSVRDLNTSDVRLYTDLGLASFPSSDNKKTAATCDTGSASDTDGILSRSLFPPPTVLSPYRCEECGRSYRHASSLLNHRHTHRVGVFQCGVCPKTFCNLLALKNHRRIHSEARRHLCPDCGKAFRVSSQLFAHRRVHLRQSALTCRPCCRAFPTLAGYRAERPYACEQCGRSYRHASSLLNHRNSHRMGAFSCGACHKQFKNLMSLKNHRRIHTEPRRHLCPDCGKAFRVSSQLLCHRRIHTREKPFTCQHCDRCFSSRSNLRHHAKVHWSGRGQG